MASGDAKSRRRRDWRAGQDNGIETERLLLRGLRGRDFQSWRTGYSSRRAAQSPYDSGPVGPERLRRARFNALVRRHEQLAIRDQVYVLTAFARSSSTHIGTFDLSTIRRKDNGWANVGYVVHNHHQRRGYGLEGLVAVLRYGMTSLGYHRIEAAIRPDNAAAIALARRAGMAHEGLRRSFWLDADGWADHEIFVAIAD